MENAYVSWFLCQFLLAYGAKAAKYKASAHTPSGSICALYNGIRLDLFQKLSVKVCGIYGCSKEELLRIILSCTDEILVKDCAKACYDILNLTFYPWYFTHGNGRANKVHKVGYNEDKSLILGIIGDWGHGQW